MVLLNIVCKRNEGDTDTSNRFHVKLRKGFEAQQVSLRKSIVARPANTQTDNQANTRLEGNIYVQMPFLNTDNVCSNTFLKDGKETGSTRLEIPFNHMHNGTKHAMRHESDHDVSFYVDYIPPSFYIDLFEDPECQKPLSLRGTHDSNEPKSIGLLSMTFEMSHNETVA